MKERPILMTPENAQKCFLGKKWQTRRMLDPQPLDVITKRAPWANYATSVLNGKRCWCAKYEENPPRGKMIYCRYGEVGDRLWVREAFSGFKMERETPEEALVFYKGSDPKEPVRWRPSIHMPRWACRTVLEITEIRVERLQEISQADAIAEGAPPSHPSIDQVSREFGYPDFSRSWYAQLWESINGADSWNANPWVWTISFRKVEP